jgi:hypothetical protein
VGRVEKHESFFLDKRGMEGFYTCLELARLMSLGYWDAFCNEHNRVLFCLIESIDLLLLNS